jgi:hypothetical protein
MAKPALNREADENRLEVERSRSSTAINLVTPGQVEERSPSGCGRRSRPAQDLKILLLTRQSLLARPPAENPRSVVKSKSQALKLRHQRDLMSCQRVRGGRRRNEVRTRGRGNGNQVVLLMLRSSAEVWRRRRASSRAKLPSSFVAMAGCSASSLAKLSRVSS